jgi:hypothetical protein
MQAWYLLLLLMMMMMCSQESILSSPFRNIVHTTLRTKVTCEDSKPLKYTPIRVTL